MGRELNDTVECPRCSAEWPADCEQGIAVAKRGKCIRCLYELREKICEEPYEFASPKYNQWKQQTERNEMSYKSAVYPGGSSGVSDPVRMGADQVARSGRPEPSGMKAARTSAVEEALSRLAVEANQIHEALGELDNALSVISRPDEAAPEPADAKEPEPTGCQVVRILEKHANGLTRMRQRVERMRRLLEI